VGRLESLCQCGRGVLGRSHLRDRVLHRYQSVITHSYVRKQTEQRRKGIQLRAKLISMIFTIVARRYSRSTTNDIGWARTVLETEIGRLETPRLRRVFQVHPLLEADAGKDALDFRTWTAPS
jgi:hypothetical protein